MKRFKGEGKGMETIEEKAERVFQEMFNLKPCIKPKVLEVLVRAFKQVESETLVKRDTSSVSMNDIQKETEAKV